MFLQLVTSNVHPKRATLDTIAYALGEEQERTTQSQERVASYGITWAHMLRYRREMPRYGATIDYLEKKLPGTILIDLCCGQKGTGDASWSEKENPHFHMQEFARALGVRTYIGVDRWLSPEAVLTHGLEVLGQQETDYTTDLLIRRLERVVAERQTCGIPIDILNHPHFKAYLNLSTYFAPLKVALVRADVLSFLKVVPDNCANFTANGIDEAVIGFSKVTDLYCDVVAREIARAAKPKGAVLMNNCMFSRYLQKHGFKHAVPPDGRVEVLEKTA